jgi:hypothetical protein
MNFHIIDYPLYILIIQVSDDSDRMCDSSCMRDSGRMLDPGQKMQLRSYARLRSKGVTPVVCPTPIGRRNSGRMRDFGRMRDSGCDILTQGLIGLIEYLYHQGISSFLETQLQRTLGLNVLGSE